MTTPVVNTLEKLAATLSPEIWEARQKQADEMADAMKLVLERVASGESRSSALRAEFPGTPLRTLTTRLLRYEEGGRDALISRRKPKARDRKVTEEVRTVIRTLRVVRPELRSEELCAELEKVLGVRLAGSTMRSVLHELDLPQPVGRPKEKGVGSGLPEPLALAGAELLKGVEAAVGAVAQLTRDLQAHLEQLPAPGPEVVDDGEHRDENGRFQGSYNRVEMERTEPEIGRKFDSVESRRKRKDLQKMRVAEGTYPVLYRKNLALTLLPCVIESPRWSALRHWQGDNLGPLVGVPYKASTVDKYLRELKYSGAGEVARESVLSHWIGTEGPYAIEGAVVLYTDTTVNPLWTRHFTRAAKVSRLGGRVMPATSTVMLNSGCGTPLLYRTFSGHVSLPAHVPALLSEYESVAGEGTARRIIVIDGEGHSVALMKELDAAGWLYIVPLRSSSIGPNARFEGLEEGFWPYKGKDGLREGRLWLNDSKKPHEPLQVRVVGRRRHRTKHEAFYATNAPMEAFDAKTVLDLYFLRWPAQEHVFRDGNGRVHMGAHHGYGKKKVDNVAVIDRVEKLDAKVRTEINSSNQAFESASALDRQQAEREVEVLHLEERIESQSREIESALAAPGVTPEEIRPCYERLRGLQAEVPKVRTEAARLSSTSQGKQREAAEHAAKAEAAAEQRAELSRRMQIFTIDTELDELMTAFKITFMNLCAVLMGEYLGLQMLLDTLIRGVLTLPGERVTTKTTETIRIYRHDRDPKTLAAVDVACRKLTDKRLIRDKRRLVFELVDRPET